MTNSRQLFVCTITGIVIDQNIPSIQGKAIEYLSPLAQHSVAMQYAKLPYQELHLLPPNILGGILLSLMNSYSLNDDKIEAFNRNKILSYSTKYDLYQAIYLLANVTKKQASELPSYSMDMVEPISDKEAKIKLYNESFLGYIKTLRENLTGTYYENNKEAHTIDYVEEQELKSLGLLNKSTILKVKTSNLKATKEAYKKHLEVLKTEKTIENTKVLEVLKTISQGNNLETASADIRTKLNTKLVAYMEFIEDTTVRGSITAIMNLLSKTSPTPLNEASKEPTEAPKVRKSLKEILAERNRSQEAIADTSPLPSSSIKESNNV